MKRILFSLIAGMTVVSGGTLQALSLGGAMVDVDVQSGWRQDNLNFNITGPKPDENPNVYEERKWESVKTWDSYGRIDVEYCKVLVRGYGNYGLVYSGRSDTYNYAADDRESLSGHNSYVADRGEMFDFGFAFGYRLPWCYCDQHFVFTPLVGWSQHEQHLVQKKGLDETFIVLNSPWPLTGTDNTYLTRWQGPWLGYNLTYCAPCNFTFHHMFEWHWVKFKAKGHDHYNFEIAPPYVQTITQVLYRTDYRQHDHGQGYLVGGGAEYALNSCWSLGITGYYMSMWTSSGKSKTEVTQPVASSFKSKLNEVNWHNWAVRGELDYIF